MTSSLLAHLFLLSTALVAVATGLTPTTKSYLVTGANKGQGAALCQRILQRDDTTHVFLCSRDRRRGEEAAAALAAACGPGAAVEARIDVLQLDVTDPGSVEAALERVRRALGPEGRLSGVVSNAGILWGHPLPELVDVCTAGVRRVLEAFAPLVEEDGRVVVVTSGLGPLMHSYASKERQAVLMDGNSVGEEDRLDATIDECLAAYARSPTIEARIAAFEEIGFPGGPFADAAPDFHMYGLAKMFGDALMLRAAARHPRLRVNSVDPGLVYTDLILNMPKYAGLAREETGAQSPAEGVEGTMRLLFDHDADAIEREGGERSGKVYALNKQRQLVFSDIDRMPQKQ